MYSCRLKKINLSSELERKYLIPYRYSTFYTNQEVHKYKQTLKSIQNKCTPYTFENLGKKNKGFIKLKPLEIEFACGIGDFLVNVASRNPNKNFIGIDLAWPCLQRAIKKANQLDLNNVLFYLGDALDFLAYDFQHFLFDRIMINFPDPWPKKKHWRRRIVSPYFIKLAIKRLKNNGEVITTTDVYSLFLYHNTLFQENSHYQKMTHSKNNQQLINYYKKKSKYQEKNLSKSNKIFFTYYKKT